MKFLAGSVIARMKYFVIVGNGRIQKITRRLVKGGSVFGIFLAENSRRLFLVGRVAVYDGNPQIFGGVVFDNPSEFVIISFSHRHGGDCKD